VKRICFLHGTRAAPVLPSSPPVNRHSRHSHFCTILLEGPRLVRPWPPATQLS